MKFPEFSQERLQRIFLLILFLFLLTDTAISFLQYFNLTLDGDMADVIVPHYELKKMLTDPLGLHALLNQEIYRGPNRFFSHWFMMGFFRHIPCFLQNFMNPISSVYASSAIVKTAVHLTILFFLSVYISGSCSVYKKNFLIAAALVAPFFQTTGYYHVMGIIDRSVTYVFFYALPICFILIYFLPFFKEFFHDRPVRKNAWIVFLIPLSFIINLGGPLNPGIMLITCFLILVVKFHDQLKLISDKYSVGKIFTSLRNMPSGMLFLFGFSSLLSLYSLYIGRFNSENISDTLTLAEKYTKLPAGIYGILTSKLAFPLIILMITVNTIIINKQKKADKAFRILKFIKWVTMGIIAYICLLPLGGFRTYRPLIVRYDTWLPVTLALILLYGMSSLYILKTIQGKGKKLYLLVLIVFALIFTIEDKPVLAYNDCERETLEVISHSAESTVLLETDCNIMSWGKFNSPEESILNADLLKIWGITDNRKLYYQK